MYFENNMKLLQEEYKDYYSMLLNYKSSNEMDITIEKSKSDSYTAKIKNNSKDVTFYLHSKYNPTKEAKDFVDKYNDSTTERYLVFGIGFGYHIREFITQKPNASFTIVESNIDLFLQLLKITDISWMVKNNKIKIVLIDTNKAMIDFAEQLLLLDQELVIFQPSLNCIPNKFQKLKEALEEFKVKTNNSLEIIEKLHDNFLYNIQNVPSFAEELTDKFYKKTVIIVGGGPSLDKAKEELVHIKEKAIILAVGTSVKPLLSVGIKPDFVIITDPQDIVVNQITNIELDVPLFLLSTCNKFVTKSYSGQKYLILQSGFEVAEDFAHKNQRKLFLTGGSVVTTALDLAIRFNSNKIILVGTDFAFPNEKTHAEGTYFYSTVHDTNSLRTVRNNRNILVYTNKNLSIYRKWIENRVREVKDIQFINSCLDGAYIEGFEVRELSEIFKNY